VDLTAGLPDGLRVGVLCGGPSAEREVSLQSGAAVVDALRDMGLDPEQVVLDDRTVEHLPARFDLLFNALHGAFGEDGELQTRLDDLGLPVTGGCAPLSAACAFDKAASKSAFGAHEVPTPEWAVIEAGADPAEALAASTLSLPVAVKPIRAGSSQGVTLVERSEDLPGAVEAARAYDNRVMLERLIRGRELTVGLLAGEVLPVVEMRARRGFYDYEAKYTDEGTEYLCPAPLLEREAVAVRTAAADALASLGRSDMARVDLLLEEGQPWVLEVNTVPGFTSHSLLPKAAAAAGIPFGELCLQLLTMAWQRRPAEA
jgi:D-alanine-D-alanine ligase